MNIVADIDEWRRIRKTLQKDSIGFIPTMGNLHKGHLTLCNRSVKENSITVVSVFINPTQFDNQKDYDLYPRTLDNDIALLSKCNVDYVFIPDYEALYPDKYEIHVKEATDLSLDLEGKYRQNHFDGVLTIVLKLLNLIQPNNAYFGEKDYQQLLLIRKMVIALFLQINIVACETVRDKDELAFSSRNSLLDQNQRVQAALFPKILKCNNGSTDEIKSCLENHGFKVDYVVDKWNRRLAAVRLGNIRLIDNFPIVEIESLSEDV